MMVTKKEIIQRINEYLKGTLSDEEAYRWASDILKKAKYGELNKDIEEALWALWGLHDKEERFKTAREDLIKIKSKLQKNEKG